MTFLEFLNSVVTLDCDLIIGGAEMPATFVWNSDLTITEYGTNKYKPIMDATYTHLENGNIEVLCDDYKLGEEFCLASAGYISGKEYDKIFRGRRVVI